MVDSFCWWGICDGVYIPAFLLRYRGISPSAKLCFARLVKFCGQSEVCFPSQETIAEELGVSIRSIGGYLQELEEDGFIEIIRQGLQRPNHYRPLRHQLLNVVFGGSASDPDRQDVADQDTQHPADHSIKLKEIKLQGNQTTTGLTGSTQPEKTYTETRMQIEQQLGRSLKNSEMSRLQAQIPYPDGSDVLEWAKSKNIIDASKPKWPKRENQQSSKPIKPTRHEPITSIAVIRDIRAEVASRPAVQALFFQFLKNDRELTEPDMADALIAITELQLSDEDLMQSAGHAERNFPKWTHIPGPGNYLRKHKPWTTLKIDNPVPRQTGKRNVNDEAREMYYREHPEERPHV